ncbi:MAG: EVE domain-containing protein [Xanthomonadales bacterium]|nr:EVE domain-containing protein [Xanthomonadales bacterium]
MSHWLLKTEPGEFSIADLEARGREPWTGVRNHQARNYLRAMRLGDRVLIYHSSCAVPAVTGIGEVCREAYPDPTQFDPESPYFDPRSDPARPRWSAVDIAFGRRLARAVPLAELRTHPALAQGFALTRRGNRLSVMPVTAAQWAAILSLEHGP